MGSSFNIHKPWLSLDDWQKEFINTMGNCFLLCGRQVGKSTAASIKCGEIACKLPKQDILVVALTEKQAYELFFKTLNYIMERYPHMVLQGKEKPTKHEIKLKNGSMIRCHACGQTGDGLRGYTLTRLIIDEAAPMNKEIFTAIMPMMSVTGGAVDIMSTPRGKEGFFYECSQRDDFKKFYVSAEDCPRHDKKFLDMQKAMMSELEYAQEYLAVFLDELKRIFPDELIKKCCILKREQKIGGDMFLGVDVARLGEDETTFEIIEQISEDRIFQRENLVTKKQLITQTTDKIIELNKQWNFKAIGVDDGGAGAGVFDNLLREGETRRKVSALNNARRGLDREEKQKKRLLKEDMYMNMLSLMEKGKLRLLDDEDLILSLKSVQYEYVLNARSQSALRIFGSYTHIVEGLIRAAWLISQSKHLNLWVGSVYYGVR